MNMLGVPKYTVNNILYTHVHHPPCLHTIPTTKMRDPLVILSPPFFPPTGPPVPSARHSFPPLSVGHSLHSLFLRLRRRCAVADMAEGSGAGEPVRHPLGPPWPILSGCGAEEQGGPRRPPRGVVLVGRHQQLPAATRCGAGDLPSSQRRRAASPSSLPATSDPARQRSPAPGDHGGRVDAAAGGRISSMHRRRALYPRRVKRPLIRGDQM
jgi:hypothetical protein